MRAASLFVFAALAVLACSSKENPRALASATASQMPPPAPKDPPSVPEEVTFESEGKIPLAGTLYLAKDRSAPLLVLVHRYRGDRQEWAPLATRLAAADKRYTILTFDLRGHGASRSGAGNKRLDWANMTPKEIPALVKDVHAAIAQGFARTEDKSSRVVLIGSSLGGALAARAASQDARVVAIGLVSPGGAIEGFDVYHPFADVRMLPSFLAGAKNDNVSKEPIDGMSRMAKELATVKLYDGRGHGAFGLFAEGDALINDLEEWLTGVFDAQPISRELVPREGEAGRKKTQEKGPVP